jgi:DNA polymerase-3 subunit beta
MKIECLKEKLDKALFKVNKVTIKNSSVSPILACLLLEASNGKLTIKGTNLDLGVEIKIPVKIEEEGSVCVDASVISNFVSNIFDKNINLETKDNTLLVSTNHTKTTIKTFSIDEFPLIPKIDNKSGFIMQGQDFIKGLKNVVYSASVSSIKPTLSSVMVYQEEDNIYFVATDSFRLAEKKIKIKKTGDFESILIPYKNISEIIKVFDDVSGDLNIFISENQISISFEDIYLISRIVEGNFPDYRQFIPSEFKTEVVFLKQDLINTLKISNIFMDKFSQVYFDISKKDNKFEIRTKNIDIGENKNKVEALVKGEDLSISFNYKYIIDCFQSIESDSVGFYFDNTSKLIIKGINDKTYFYLVMSMNK